MNTSVTASTRFSPLAAGEWRCNDRCMRILVAEDDSRLRSHLVDALRSAGHAVDEAGDGAEASWLLREADYDAAVIDINMPGKDGVSVVREARAGGHRAMMLLSTARGDLRDKVAGLDAGADDYLVKPYSTEELLARLRALDRRRRPELSHIIRVEDLEIDLLGRAARRGDSEIVLTNREFALLEVLATASPRPVSKALLVEKVWDQYFDAGSNVVNVYVNYLRKKVDLPGLTPLIQTVRGIGFALKKDASA